MESNHQIHSSRALPDQRKGQRQEQGQGTSGLELLELWVVLRMGAVAAGPLGMVSARINDKCLAFVAGTLSISLVMS